MYLNVGDRVADQWGCTGVIQMVYDDFSACAASCVSLSGDEWLAEQESPFSSVEQSELWFLVACDTGGSIWSPESRLIPESV